MQRKIKRIRSGGQTGCDRAALDVARVLGIPITGWAPARGWAEDMEDGRSLTDLYPELSSVDTEKDGIWLRTERNVRESDATLIIYPKKSMSFGTDFTAELADRYDKPFHIASLEDPSEEKSTLSWLNALPDGIELNVAGPRESECIGGYELTCSFLLNILRPSGKEKKKIALPDWVYHSYGVAEKMYNLSKEECLGEPNCQDMWLLGFLHDIGKRFTGPTYTGHASYGGDLLSRNDYVLADFVKGHNAVPIQGEHFPWLLKTLLRADLSVSQGGLDIGYEARLEDIKARYGENSEQYKAARETIERLEDREDE